MNPDEVSWQRELAARWAVLRDRTSTQGIATSALPLKVREGSVLVGVDRRGDRHLLVPVPWGADVLEDAEAAHIRVQRRELVFDGSTGLFVDVVCHRPDLGALFDDVLAEILDRLSTPLNDAPDAVCLGVLDEWREVLRRRGGVLGESALRGLFGELVVLEQVLDAGDGHGVAAWSGPDREPHDFRLPAGDLEVKTLGVTGAEVEVHGLDQLEPPHGGSLHLVLVRLATAQDGASLPELVERIRSRATDASAFAASLSTAGYRELDADRYRDRRFRVDQLLALRVDEWFPRITDASLKDRLPEEITSLTYRLDVSALLPQALTGPALRPLFAKGEE